MLIFECRNKLVQVIIKQVKVINVGIVFYNGLEFFLDYKVDFCMRMLLLQASDHRRCEHNVTYGGKSDNQEFDRFIHFLFLVVIEMAANFAAGHRDRSEPCPDLYSIVKSIFGQFAGNGHNLLG